MKKLFLISAVLLAVVVSGCSSSSGGSGDVTAPTVLSVAPLNGAINVPVSPTISVTFDEAMDKTVTAAAFNNCGVSGTVGWSAGDTVMTFTPGSALANGTLFSCSVNTTATDVAANPLAVAKVWSFTTVAGTDITKPTVLSTDPADGDDNVPGTSLISVTFDEAMNQSSAAGAFNINPYVVGTFSWAGNIMTFHPTANLGNEKLYNCWVGTDAKDLAGNPLDHTETWSFTTGTAPTITGVSPADDAIGVGVSTTISVTFDMAMDQTSTEAAFNKCGVLGSFGWSGGATVMTFTPYANLLTDTTYNCSVGTGAKDSTYAIPLAAAYPWSFSTTDTIPPTVLSVIPAGGAVGVLRSYTLTRVIVTFSEPMNTGSVAGALTESIPTYPGANWTTVWSAGDTVMTINRLAGAGDWQATTLYTFSLGTGATDAAGNNLAAAYPWSWTTGTLSGVE